MGDLRPSARLMNDDASRYLTFKQQDHHVHLHQWPRELEYAPGDVNHVHLHQVSFEIGLAHCRWQNPFEIKVK
jgi:hypothetical protein